MANFTTSPGVAISEIDNTFLTGQPVQAGAAIIGPTVKGPVEVPTLVTSYSGYQTLFGDTFISGGNSYSYLQWTERGNGKRNPYSQNDRWGNS